MALAEISRRKFLVTAGAVAGVSALRPLSFYGASPSVLAQPDYASRLHSDHRDQANRIGSKAHRVCNYLQRPVSGSSSPLQRRPACHGRCTQRDRRSRAASLAWTGYSVGCRRCGRRRNTFDRSSWKPQNFVRSKALWLSLLSHACPGWQRPQQRAI
jgi:hypothetical protein